MKVQIIPAENRKVQIIIPEELQSVDFADEYLKIQDLYSERCSSITVVFSNTVWIDNLAMIQLFSMLYKLKQLGTGVEFKLEVDLDAIEQVRFIKYMSDYGFLDMMENCFAVCKEEDFDREELDSKYGRLQEGNFESSECLMPFTIISHKEKIDEYIAEVTDTFQNKFGDCFSEYEKAEFIFRMSVYLQETIGNVFDHAFDNPKDAFCGIMIRYMHKPDMTRQRRRYYYSLQNNSSASRPFRGTAFTYHNSQKIAEDCNPYRIKTGMKVLESYIQIFVTDVGMGILESMNISDANMERNLLNEIFQIGRRTTKNIRNTSVGGLGMLYQLLQGGENYIAIKGEYNWVQIACAKKKEKSGKPDYTHKNGITSSRVLKGFTVIGYIDCDYERKKEFFMPVSKETVQSIYREEYFLEDMCDVEADILDLRGTVPDISTIASLTNTVLCFVGKNISKSIWSNQVANLFRGTNQDKKTLILVDIPEREARKYELIFDRFKLNVNKVILLTQNLELAVFTPNDESKLCYNAKMAEEYINSREGDIAYSLYQLFKAIRRHESIDFWKTVSSTQQSKESQLFINENVLWNMSEKRQMNGYLDFSQACFDEKIRNLLLYQLFRLPVDYNKERYFENMDRFTEDLCENVNNKLKIVFGEQAFLRVQLGSVYVTGTSSKSSKLEKKQTDSDEYYYFLHPINSENQTIRINALLLWPSKAVADEVFTTTTSERKFERLAKTPFLAPGGTAYFAGQHYTDIGESVALKPEELYALLQQESLWINKMMKIAHVNMIDHHDYIYLSAVAIFRKHYMESRFNEKYLERNSFDYLLEKMYIALGRTKRKSFVKSIEEDIQPEYRLIVEGKICGDIVPMIQGLFIYLTDYETVEIVAKLKTIFSEKVQRNIIPIASISKKRSSSALLVSPVLMENIKKKIKRMEEENPKGITRVTIFIASVTSTKLQRELKHILYRLGAKQIKCLSLIDRQRFPLGSREKDSYNSFCKIDLPQLGSENRCKLCTGINYMKELKTRFISADMQKRCQEIIFTWGEVRASDNLYERGIHAQWYRFPRELTQDIERICQQYQINGIDVSTDVGLTLFSIENTVITMSVDFLLRCINNEKIDDTVKIMMISAHLFMFGSEEIVPADKYYLAEYLYSLLQRQEEANEYTALACITILTQKKEIKDRLFEKYKQVWERERFKNIDFIISSVGLMETVEKSKQDKVLSYWVKKVQEEYLDYLYGIFLMTDGSGVTRHKTTLSRIKEAGWKCSRMDYLSAENDAAFLEEAYQCLPYSYFAVAEEENYQRKREDIIGKIKDVRQLLGKALSESESLADNDRRLLAEYTVEMFRCASDFNSELFMNSGEDCLRSLRKKLQDFIDLIKFNYPDSDIRYYVNVIHGGRINSTRYFYYMEDLQREIIYLISDFRHADKNNPMIGENGEKYEGIVEVKFENDCVKYCFTNHVKDDFSCEVVKRKKEVKHNRPTMLNLRMLVAGLNNEQLLYYTHNKAEKTFTVELRIPYLVV